MNEKKNSQPILKRMTPGLILGFLVLLGLALMGDLRQVGQAMRTFDWRVYPAALGLTLFNYTLRFVKWHYYLHVIGIHHIAWVESLRMFVGGFPLAITPGKVGEVLKGVWINQRSGLPVARGVSVVVAERISDGLAVMALSVLGVVAYPQYWPAFVVILIGLLAVLILAQVRPAAMWALGVGERLPLVKRFIGTVREFYEGSYMLFQPAPTAVAVGLGTISWLGEGVGFYFILLGLGLEPSWQLLSLAVFILAFSTVVGAVSALPGGMGAAEVSIAGMLTLLGGLEPAQATTATVLIRLATLWFGILLGLGMWAVSPQLIGLRSAYDPSAQD